jgi:hypothetical protein
MHSTTGNPQKLGPQSEMPATESAHAPLVAWLGDPPSPELVEGLSAIADLRMGWSGDAEVIAIWAPSGRQLLRELPRGERRPFVIAATVADPTTAERLDWIKAGANDLVSAAALPGTVARWLKTSAGTRRSPSTGPHAVVSTPPPAPAPAAPPPIAAASPAPAPAPATPVRNLPRPPPVGRAITPSPMPAPPLAPLAEQPSAPPVLEDLFPPVRIATTSPPIGLDEWQDLASAYLKARDAILSQLGESALDRLLELVQLRSRALHGPTARDPLYGNAAERPDWPAAIRRGRSRKRPVDEAIPAVICSAGCDGISMEAELQTSPKQRLVVDLPLSAIANLQLLVEVRWQRRLTTSRYQLGAVLLEMRTRPLA